MFEIDGSQKSGSGTILRLSVSLAAASRKPLHIYNIRQNRSQPGLKPQHLESVLTAAKICNAELKGATLNSREIWFTPREINGGNFKAEIRTAGSIPMLLLTIMPICLFSEKPIRVHVRSGGTDVSHSPTINYLKNVFLIALRRMGLDFSINIHRYGYYPKGNGEVTMDFIPSNRLEPLKLDSFGEVKKIRGISVCTFLSEQKVAERQASFAFEYLRRKGFNPDIEIVNDRSNILQKGSSIVLWTETSLGPIIGADAIGELGKRSETVGTEAAVRLDREISMKSTVDSYLADMLIPYVALARGKSIFLTGTFSDHLETNIWLAEKMLGTKFRVEKEKQLFKIEKTG